jgi:hypothetical protein
LPSSCRPLPFVFLGGQSEESEHSGIAHDV